MSLRSQTSHAIHFLGLHDRRMQLVCLWTAAIAFVSAVAVMLLFGITDPTTFAVRSDPTAKRDALLSDVETAALEHADLKLHLSSILAHLRRASVDASRFAMERAQILDSVRDAKARTSGLGYSWKRVDDRGNRLFSSWKGQIKRVPGRDNRRPLIAEYKTSQRQFRKLHVAVTSLRAGLTPLEERLERASRLLEDPAGQRFPLLPGAIAISTHLETQFRTDLRTMARTISATQGAAKRLAIALPDSIPQASCRRSATC